MKSLLKFKNLVLKPSAFLLAKNIFAVLIALFLSSSAFSQQSEKLYKVNYKTPEAANLKMASQVNNLEVAKEGTFQIVRLAGVKEEIVQQLLIDQVESYRSQDQVIYLKAGENTWIKILPYSEIQSPDFKPIDKEIYIDESLDK